MYGVHISVHVIRLVDKLKCVVTQLLYQLLHIYKIYKIYTLKH